MSAQLSQEVFDAFQPDLQACDLLDSMARATAATKDLTAALQRLRELRRSQRHQRLFGHPPARVFIVGDRLLVLHPGGAA